MTKSAVAYRANGKIVIAPIVRTTSGLSLEIDPIGLGSDPDLGAIVDALAQALIQSDRVVRHPAQHEWKGSFDPFLKAAGVRSLKAFMAAARSVSLEESDWAFVLTPYRNLDPKEGFEPLPNEAATLPDLERAALAVVNKLEFRERVTN